MSANTTFQTGTASPLRSIAAGGLAGIGGGIVFGIMMGMMNMLPMVGMLARSESALIGFVVHMAISVFIGGVYGFAARSLPSSAASALLGGAVNGVAWWVLGALVLMPLMLGMGQMVFVVGQAQWMSLLGHLIYGVITALLFIPLNRRLNG